MLEYSRFCVMLCAVVRVTLRMVTHEVFVYGTFTLAMRSYCSHTKTYKQTK